MHLYLLQSIICIFFFRLIIMSHLYLHAIIPKLKCGNTKELHSLILILVGRTCFNVLSALNVFEHLFEMLST